MEAQHRCWPVGFFPLSRSFASSTPQLLPRCALIFPSQACILRFAISSTVTCFPFCFKCFSIRSASCVVFGISQGCSSYRVLVVSSKTLFFASKYLTSRPHFVAMRPMFSFFEPVMRFTHFFGNLAYGCGMHVKQSRILP